MGRGVCVYRTSGRLRGVGLSALTAGALALALTGCGGGDSQFTNTPRPPVQVDLSVYIDNHHVSVSPTNVGAGPVLVIVTNQASSTQTLTITNRAGSSVASSGHIHSGQTAQISTDLRTGTYDVATSAKISAARLKIGTTRPNADNVLLAP